ncbi:MULTISPECIES: tRNA uridine-5-carboxymethylaminomethyl(34) synthesis GTPase MnmE [Sphingomonas]|uniref:tRNA uridine-5-carboxymethylaminomethyl(34) synthesis GTPase MnmE n=1 Tax=Sphingomonas TaxID=13687 RepID=UPI000DEFFAE8|nr:MULTISPECIES: tRNA uridine-5-carboxymethylaminomethyl(34) synthesis GTPase MnmE [Sphingomonas]
MTDQETIFALSSGRPPAGIAVIRLSGSRAHAAAAALAGALPPAREARLRTLRASDGSVLDQALLLRFDGPASATGEDLVEFHCHGGRAVVAAVCAALAAQPGVREAEPGEFTRRAVVNGRIDLTEAEGLADLLEAETEWQRRAAVGAAEGSTRRLIEDWRRRVIELSAQAEAAIDYVGDEDETALDEPAFSAAIVALADEWRVWLARPRADLLREGVRIVLAGPPNAGKSSLFNALVGRERAIVTEVAGTTRDALEAPIAIDGVPLVLVDTAGLRETGDQVEAIGVERAHAQVAGAGIVLWLGAPDEAPDHSRVIKVHAQIDRRGSPPPSSFGVSALTGEGIATLLAAVRDQAASAFPPPDLTSLNRRQADLLAEALNALSCVSHDIVIAAYQLRLAREALDRITGQSSTEEMLDSLFGRFCLGK